MFGMVGERQAGWTTSQPGTLHRSGAAMPSLFRDDKFLAQIDEFDHQMVVVQVPSGEFVDAYGVNFGPYMLLFQENELDDLVAFAKALRDGMTESKASPAAKEARAIAAIVAHEFNQKAADKVISCSDKLGPQPVYAPQGRSDN
jgi:hypothetical protein